MLFFTKKYFRSTSPIKLTGSPKKPIDCVVPKDWK